MTDDDWAWVQEQVNQAPALSTQQQTDMRRLIATQAEVALARREDRLAA